MAVKAEERQAVDVDDWIKISVDSESRDNLATQWHRDLPRIKAEDDQTK